MHLALVTIQHCAGCVSSVVRWLAHPLLSREAGVPAGSYTYEYTKDQRI